jgi:hypothetical protein
MEQIDKIANFESWKKMAGLPKEFPRLRCTEEFKDEEFQKRTFISKQDKIDVIMLRLNNPVICVTVNKGHGCTTLYRHISTLVKNNCLIRRIIPVEIDLKTFWNKDFSLNIIEIIKRSILHELMSKSWNMVLSDPVYYDIVGGFEASDKSAHKHKIEAALREKNWTEIEKLCPKFALPINELLKQISEKHQIKVVIFFDIPYDAKQQYLEYLTGSIKDIYEEYKELPGISEIFFMTPEHLETMQRSYPRPIEIIDYNSKGYNFGEVVKILSLRYRPISFETVRGIEDPLLIVFDQRFAQLAWSKDYTLHEITEEMERLILERLDCEDKDIPFKLEPTNEQIKKWEEKNVKRIHNQ